jgi:hypothetical protein
MKEERGNISDLLQRKAMTPRFLAQRTRREGVTVKNKFGCDRKKMTVLHLLGREEAWCI